MSFKLFLVIYLFGGITFPLFLVWILFQTSKQAEPRTREVQELLVPEINADFKAGEIEEPKGVEVQKKGWLTVTTHYFYHHTELLGMDDANEDLPTRADLKRKHKFFAILKHGNLFLYRDDSSTASVVHAIVLKDSFITLWPRDPENEGLEASLFTKKTCIAIFKNGITSLTPENKLKFERNGNSSLKSLDEFFIYVSNNVEKEDWYFSLISASKVSSTDKGSNLLNANVSAQTAHFKTRDVLSLIQTLNSTEGQLTTKWLNALIGRLFLGLQQTETSSLYLRDRLHKKLTKINKPGFLDDFIIESVDVGTAAPFLTYPHLKELTVDGLTRIGFNLMYKGKLSLIVSTKANINLSSRFKKREVRIELAITIKEIRGPMIILIKPPPTDRAWYSFEMEPYLDLDVEPVVSTRQLSYNMVTNVIKSKFKEAIKESIVMPFMDDIPFYKTSNEFYRGGIWNKCDNNSTNAAQPKKQTEQTEQNRQDKQDERGEQIESPELEDNAAKESKTVPEYTNLYVPQRKSTDASSEVRSFSSSELHEGFDEPPQRSQTHEGQDSTVKQKTLKKVETFKSMLRSHRGSGSSEHGSDESDDSSWKSDGENVPSTAQDDAPTSKKYLHAGMKKFGRWYKDAVNNSKMDSTNDGESSSNAPEMISSRRALPKDKERNDSRPLPVAEPRSSSAAEMFANKNRTESTSSTSSQGSPVFNSYRFNGSPNQSPSLGSRRAPVAHEFPEEFFQDNSRNMDNHGTNLTGDTELSKELSHVSEEKPQANLGQDFNNARLDSNISAPMDGNMVNLHEMNRRRPVPPLPYAQGKEIADSPSPNLDEENGSSSLSQQSQ